MGRKENEDKVTVLTVYYGKFGCAFLT